MKTTFGILIFIIFITISSFRIGDRIKLDSDIKHQEQLIENLQAQYYEIAEQFETVQPKLWKDSIDIKKFIRVKDSLDREQEYLVSLIEFRNR